MNAKISSMALALAGVVFLGASPVAAHAQESSEKDRSTTAQLAYGLMSDTRYAYRPHELDDALSSEIFDAYVDALDPEGVRFAPADLQALEKHRFKLDTAIRRGALEPVYEIAAARTNVGGEPQDKDGILEVFLNAYARSSDGDGSYRSPFVEAPTQAAPGAADEPLASVRSSVVEAGGERIGVIAVSHLHSTPQQVISVDVSEALARFNRDGVETLVLDLRGNEGGALREVVELAGLFLGPMPVMQIREAGGRVGVESSKAVSQWEGRLGVLVDRETAAGAEMLAAALQDHGRGILLGERTFGRGTIQNPVDLDAWGSGPRRYGLLSLTIAEMFRLNGHPLDGVGVTPNYELPLNAAPRAPAVRVAVSDPIAPARGFTPVPRALSAPSLALPQQEDSGQSITDPVVAKAVLIVHGLADITPDAPAAERTPASRLERYARTLQAHVVDRWVYPESALAMDACKVHVRQLPGGEVIEIAFDPGCPVDPGFRQSIQTAIVKSSPLPYAGFEDVFSRNVTMNFKAEPDQPM
ncbi:S41 family peptidase [Lysobacter sp. A286]